MIFSITGYMGSGKSTICNILTNEYNFRIVSAGSIFRNIGMQNNSSVLDMTRKLDSNNDESIDHYIDEQIKKEYLKVKENENVIFDSRLAWYFLENTFKIFIVISPYQAASRTYSTRVNKDEKYESLEDAIDGLVERRVLENRRYKKIYGINCEDLNNYDLVIDTSHISAKQAADIIMDCYKKKMADQEYEKFWISPDFVFPTLRVDSIDKEKVRLYVDKINNNVKLEKVKLIRIHDALFIENQHEIVMAYNISNTQLFNPLLTLSEDDLNNDGIIVKNALSITEKDIEKWEELNGFKYNYCPKIIKKKSLNNYANS